MQSCKTFKNQLVDRTDRKIAQDQAQNQTENIGPFHRRFKPIVALLI